MFTIKDLVSIALTYLAAHIVVFCLYRVTLHPYAKYPGPFLAKFTSLYGAYHAYHGDIHLDVERCHKKYGKFVRYAPNSLLVDSPEGFHDIYDNLKKVKKAKSYKVHGQGNLIGIQDKAEYAWNKKIFQQGFSDTAIREHEPKVIKEIDTFIEKLSENETPEKNGNNWTNPKNMALWCNWLTTDVVSKVVFTTSWDLMTSSANRGVTECFKTIVRLVGILHYWPHQPTHEIGSLILLPHLAWSVKDLMKYSKEVMASSKAARIEDPSIKDVFGFFSSVKDPNTGELALTPDSVRRNTANFIIAGSDTTASSIAATFFYLSHNPTAYAKVAQEVRSAFPSVASIRAGPTLNNCVYLRAAINESLRMSPVAPQPLWREAEEGGCLVDGELIPAGLKVASGIFSLHHNEELFPDSYKYDIERWIIDPKKDEEKEKERIKEMSKSYAPFSAGPRQCIAKNFALMELMLTMANVFVRLDFEKVGTLGEGRKGMGEGREREGEFQMKSYFTSYMEGPMIRFKTREV
ncbi:cytochrome P450 [Mollisia scopiformis]|uniref:Cytochrome P450 n=1 Tax=Mollisia scopiformis TaxID=149040 RepID=A0A194XQ42_MOLSC|nr:cytochrome P450 [Mollisia scopiformis]KUJ22174.1 cytochrome P450 [Mollisia scopiformis]